MVIVDMKMPKSCVECIATFDNYVGRTCCSLGANEINWDKRPKDCPIRAEVEELKEIPENYKYDTETDDFLVYRHKYNGREIHIVKPTQTYVLANKKVIDTNEQ